MSPKSPMTLHVDDVVELRKAHPCGGRTWRILRVGADIGIECQTCRRYIMLPRKRFESQVKRLVHQEEDRGK